MSNLQGPCLALLQRDFVMRHRAYCLKPAIIGRKLHPVKQQYHSRC